MKAPLGSSFETCRVVAETHPAQAASADERAASEAKPRCNRVEHDVDFWTKAVFVTGRQWITPEPCFF